VTTTGHAFAKPSANSFVIISTESDDRILGYKSAREFVITVFALIADALLCSRGQLLVSATLGLRETLCQCFQLPWVFDDFAVRERQQILEAGVYTDLSVGDVWD
jgi:hypothetical protein